MTVLVGDNRLMKVSNDRFDDSRLMMNQNSCLHLRMRIYKVYNSRLMKVSDDRIDDSRLMMNQNSRIYKVDDSIDESI